MEKNLDRLRAYSLKLIAVVVALLFLGPGIIAGAEFIALVEFIGVEVFLLMYCSLAMEYCRKSLRKWIRFERKFANTCFASWVPNESIYKNISSFFIPERTLYYIFILCVFAALLNFSYQLVVAV